MEIQNVNGLVTSMNDPNQDKTLWQKAIDWFSGNDSNSKYEMRDFIGLTKDSVQLMEGSINNNIISPCQKLINDFGATKEQIEQGLKGQTATAADEYVAMVKMLLEAYISYYKSFVHNMKDIFAKMEENDKGNAEIITEAAHTIKSMAEQIRVN